MPDDPSLRIFPDEFVPNIQASDAYKRWARSSPADRARWVAFRDALVAGQTPSVPVMSTKFGHALVATGKEHMSISQLVGQVTNPYPPPDPPATPPPPPGGLPPKSTSIIRLYDRIWEPPFSLCRWTFSDQFNWEPTEKTGTLWRGLYVGQEDISTPYGNGIRITCLNEMEAEWNPSARISLADDQTPSGWLNTSQQWDGYLRFPSAMNSGLSPSIYEGHNILQIANTSGGQFVSTNGHKLWVTTDRRLRFTLRQQAEPFATSWYTTPDQFSYDTWIHLRWEIRHSTDSDGFQRAWIDGDQIVDYSGPTIFTDEDIWSVVLQWYSTVGVDRNQVDFAAMQLATI